MVRKCAHVLCKNSDENSPLSFHIFPRDEPRFSKWLASSGRKLRTGEKMHFCPIHFTGGRGPTKANPDPVPFNAVPSSRIKIRKRLEPKTRVSPRRSAALRALLMLSRPVLHENADCESSCNGPMEIEEPENVSEEPLRGHINVEEVLQVDLLEEYLVLPLSPIKSLDEVVLVPKSSKRQSLLSGQLGLSPKKCSRQERTAEVHGRQIGAVPSSLALSSQISFNKASYSKENHRLFQHPRRLFDMTPVDAEQNLENM